MRDLMLLQHKLNTAIISWCRNNESELRELVADAHAGIPLQVAEGRRQHVGFSVLPIIADPANIDFARRSVSATLVARWALLSAVSEDGDLRAFLTSGLSEIAREAGLANRLPTFFRGRTDTMISLRGEPSCGVVEFNGEPLGEHFIGVSEKIISEIVERMAGYRLRGKFACHPYDTAFERFLDAYHELRRRGDGSLPAKPNFGYFVNKDPVAQAPYERLAYPAGDRLRRLEEHHGISGRLFHTSEIEGFSKVRIDGKEFFLPRVDGRDLHVIRWLHDEPFEFETFWQELRAGRPEIYYPLTGVTHPNHNPEGGSCLLAINGFSTFPTDKKLDVILGDPDLRRRFQLTERIGQILRDEEAKEELRIPEGFTKESVLELLDRAMPRSRMLRRKGSGLYPESGAEDEYGLSEEEIERLIAERDQWVIKLSGLSCSSIGVFVGRAFGIEGLREVLHDEGSTALPQWPPHASTDTQRDLLWSALVRHALDKGDCIAQRAIDARTVDGFVVRTGEALPERTMSLRFDYNFMSLGAKTIHALFRVTTAEDVTSIAGGQGGLAVSITPDDAEEILRKLGGS